MLTDSGIPAGDVRLYWQYCELVTVSAVSKFKLSTYHGDWMLVNELDNCTWRNLDNFINFSTKNYVQSNHNSQVYKSINTYCLPLSNLKTLKIVSLLAVLLIFSLHKSCKINLKSTWLALYCATITHGLNRLSALIESLLTFCVFKHYSPPGISASS